MVSSGSTIKIATFNIQSGIRTTKGYWQYLVSFWKYVLPHSSEAIKRVADFMNSEGIDIITFSEIEGKSFRGRQIDQADLISDLTGFRQNIFFPTHVFGKIIHQGNAVHARHPIVSSKNHRLSGQGEPRYLSEAVLEVEGQKITVFVTHLSLGKVKRRGQLDDIVKIINNTTPPIVLTGDFNTSNESELLVLNNTKLVRIATENTYPAWEPTRCLDYMFISPEFEVVKSYVPKNLDISDHLPIVLELRLG